MHSSYKKLGNYIRQVSTRNKDLTISSPMGININKVFMPSVANTVGTDLSKYRVVSKKQFAYNPMHVGRDEALPIALLQSNQSIIVSPAYVVFEVINTELLDPEYLMIWCRRAEFDRNAWFTTDNTVRGGFSWDSMCDMELPIPSIEKQREIVKEYNAVVDRIKLNERINQKLEETAQALYKHWFIDFEFPNEEGKPYKSSGGEMVYNEELEKEIPEGWDIYTLDRMCNCLDNLRKPLSGDERESIPGEYPYYGAMSIIDYINNYIYDGVYLLVSEDGANVVDEKGRPALQYIWGRFWLNNHAHIIEGKNEISTEFLMLALKNVNVAHLVTGAAQPKINQKNLMSILLGKPPEFLLQIFDSNIKALFQNIVSYSEQINLLKNLQELLLEKMSRSEINLVLGTK